MDFVAIDFETANGNSNSACQLAAVVVHDSSVQAEHSWLIRPPRSYFSPRNIAIHGIRPRDVADAPTMGLVWKELEPLVRGRVIIAHNARFDLGVLVHSLAAFEIPCPDLEFTCTRLIARRAWPGRSRYGLKPLGDWLGVQFRHHDALEDAKCCAKIALEVAKHQDEHELSALESKLNIKRGSYQSGHIKSPTAKGRNARSGRSGGGGGISTDRWGFPSSAARQAKRIDAPSIVAASAESKPLQGKRIVMLGPLGGMDWEQTKCFLATLGAEYQANVTVDTSYVVACGSSLESAKKQILGQLGLESSQESTGQASAARVCGIRILSERQFRALLPAGKVSARW